MPFTSVFPTEKKLPKSFQVQDKLSDSEYTAKPVAPGKENPHVLSQRWNLFNSEDKYVATMAYPTLVKYYNYQQG